MDKNLLSAYKNGNIILFVGAGVSNSLGLPTWTKLIEIIADELDYDPDIFMSYGENYALAEYFRIMKKGNISSLIDIMKEEWVLSKEKIRESLIHKYIVECNFPIIYTTNYDHCLEQSFAFYNKEVTKIISVSDITQIEDGRTQIVKFHGDFVDSESIVLDESSYFERLEFEAPLDIKLRSDVLGKSVLFIGYSLSDINVRFLFYKLAKLWANSNRGDQPRSYIFSPRPNHVQKAILDQWGISMIPSDIDDHKVALEEFLKCLGSKH